MEKYTVFVTMSVFCKLIYRFDTIPKKRLAGYFVEIYKLFLIFIWKCEKTKMTNNSEKNKDSQMTDMPNFKT